MMEDLDLKHMGIRDIATQVTNRTLLFEKIRTACDYHRQNTLTKQHNCFYGKAKNLCDALVCPLKEEE